MKISKQSFHQLLNRRMLFNEETGYLAQIIIQIRKDHPTLNCRALYYKIQPQHIGRDRFEQFCREFEFNTGIIRNYKRTTNSSGVIRFDNLLVSLTLSGLDQAWSSDITYYEVSGVFYYLTFIIDCFSRRIIGHYTSKHLFTEQTTLPALKMAVKTRGNLIPIGLIFHSDGGGQYYDKKFLEYTNLLKIRNSMCEMAYENGKSERVNGTIKNNYLAHYNIKTYSDLIEKVDLVVSLYNTDRPHKALNYKTPVQYEKEILFLSQQTKLKMTKSFDAKDQIFEGIEPSKSEQTKLQNQNVFTTN